MTRPPLKALFDLDKLDLAEHWRLIDLLRLEVTGHVLDDAEVVDVQQLLTKSLRPGVSNG